MNQFQVQMSADLEDAIAHLRQAKAKVEAGDIHGAQARVVFSQRKVADFLAESIACPKSEGGYVRGGG